MKRAFTLLEMMIVVALIATLMTIVLRLSSISSSEGCRNLTVMRLQRLENCLSGYYAAYGNYPPVRLHNTRDITAGSDGHGIQSDEASSVDLWSWTKVGETAEYRAWSQVDAACRAQPLGAEFPFPATEDAIASVKDLSDQLMKNLTSGEFKNYPQPGTAQYDALKAGFDGLQSNLGRFKNAKTAYSWREIQVFKFGMMSFLLPRYQMMMGGNSEIYTYFAQWTRNNGAVSNPMTGTSYTWDQLKDINDRIDNGTSTKQDEAQLENIPADAVCARWLPNLEGICSGTRHSIYYFGVNIVDASEASTYLLSPSDDPDSSPPAIHIYAPESGSNRDQYILDSITVLDGWNNEYYYYSPSPHQTYSLWSAGANGRTFPPWVPRGQLSSKANECILKWTTDDIGGMRN